MGIFLFVLLFEEIEKFRFLITSFYSSLLHDEKESKESYDDKGNNQYDKKYDTHILKLYHGKKVLK